MKKFQFRFQAILNFRQQQEQKVQKELALLQQSLELAFHTLQAQQSERDETISSLQAKQEKAMAVGPMREFLNYIDTLRQKIAQQQDEIIKLQNQIVNKRTKLMQAKKEKEVLEKLKEKYYSEWNTAYEQSQTALLDEAVTIRYQHQQLGLKFDE